MVSSWCTGRRAAAPTGRSSASARSRRRATGPTTSAGSSSRARPGRRTAPGSSIAATRRPATTRSPTSTGSKRSTTIGSAALAPPERARWKELVAQGADVLESVPLVHDTFVANVMRDAASRLRLYARDGTRLQELELPAPGTVSAISGERTDDELFYAFTSFLHPSTIFRYDFTTARTSVFHAPAIDFDPSGYETTQLFYTSRDGTRVPMFLTQRRGLGRDGSTPTLVYGYGGFNVSLTPSFSIAMFVSLR